MKASNCPVKPEGFRTAPLLRYSRNWIIISWVSVASISPDSLLRICPICTTTTASGRGQLTMDIRCVNVLLMTKQKGSSSLVTLS